MAELNEIMDFLEGKQNEAGIQLIRHVAEKRMLQMQAGKRAMAKEECVAKCAMHKSAVGTLFGSLRRDVFDPKWHRTYGPDGDTNWDGVLTDQTDRGAGFKYFCPSGWTRYAVRFNGDFDKKHAGWNVVYHGSSESTAYKILETCIIASGCDNGKEHLSSPSAYFSPSIEYCGHPRYATPFKMKDGQWGQVVLQCRIDPSGKLGHTNATVLSNQATVVDSNYDNATMEWIVEAPPVAAKGSASKIACYGLMFRKTKEHPDTLPCSGWWKKCHGQFGDERQKYGARD